uniref:uncharacterized protein LOC117609829 n=1 Tax=Osmia lignaria TaxID=473952 RepID=UPI00147842AD|nr:uncharacterized protein LOC117609829 [Osmia lignaria]
MSSFEEDIKEAVEDVSEAVEASQNEGDEIGSEISKSVTVILKAVTHRGTQTTIQCYPDQSKETFIDMIINTKI